MKTICYPLLLALLLCSSGCISSQVVNRAKGYTFNEVEPRTGDTVFLHGGRSYVDQQKGDLRKSASSMSATDLQPFPRRYYAFDPSPGYYALFVLTVPMDAATLPFQAIGVGFLYLVFHNYHGC